MEAGVGFNGSKGPAEPRGLARRVHPVVTRRLARLARPVALGGLVALAALAGRPGTPSAASRGVGPGGSAGAIQSALAASQHGDTVLVEPGEYRERVRIPPGVTLRSRGGAAATRLLADTRRSEERRVGKECRL